MNSSYHCVIDAHLILLPNYGFSRAGEAQAGQGTRRVVNWSNRGKWLKNSLWLSLFHWKTLPEEEVLWSQIRIFNLNGFIHLLRKTVNHKTVRFIQEKSKKSVTNPCILKTPNKVWTVHNKINFLCYTIRKRQSKPVL